MAPGARRLISRLQAIVVDSPASSVMLFRESMIREPQWLPMVAWGSLRPIRGGSLLAALVVGMVPGASAAEPTGLVISWSLSRSDELAVGIEFTRVQVFDVTTSVTDRSGQVQRIGNALIREIIDYPNLEAMDIVDEKDREALRQLAATYRNLIAKYPKATPALSGWIDRLASLYQASGGGEVRIRGRWMSRKRYHYELAKHREIDSVSPISPPGPAR